MQHFPYKLLHFFLFCGFLLNYGYAQTTYNIATTGTNTITTCGMTIYDDGGPNANYSSSCSSYTIIQPASSGCYVHLIGSYTTENGFDKITIYDGEGTGTTLVNAVSGTGTIDVTSSTGPLTLFFRSDGSTNKTGFEFLVECTGGCACGGTPFNIVAHETTNSSMHISWSSFETGHNYIVEYGLGNYTPGTGTQLIVSSTSCDLTNLEQGIYTIYVYIDCDNDGTTNGEISSHPISCEVSDNHYVPQSGNTSITVCTGHLYDNGGTAEYSPSCNGYTIISPGTPGCVVRLIGSYNLNSSSDYVQIYNGAGLTGGQLFASNNATDPTSGTIDIHSTNGPITVYFYSNSTDQAAGFDFSIACFGGCGCNSGPEGLTTTMGNSHIEVSWEAALDPSVHHYIIEYGPTGFTPGTGTTIRTDQTTYDITGLTNGHTYEIHVYYDCSDDGVITDETYTSISDTPTDSHFVPESGSVTKVLCDGHIYDPGGAYDDYPNSCNGYIVLYPGSPGCVLRIHGHYTMYNSSDYIRIYEGDGTNGTQLFYSGSTITGNVDITSPSGPLTVKFYSNASYVASGFDFEVECINGCACGGRPQNLIAYSEDLTSCVLRWDVPIDESVHQYIIEYGPHGFTVGSGTTVVATGNTYTITGLTMGESYDAYVYFDCDGDNTANGENSSDITFSPTNNVPLDGIRSYYGCSGNIYDSGGPMCNYITPDPASNSTYGTLILYPDSLNPGCHINIEGEYDIASYDKLYIYDGIYGQGGQVFSEYNGVNGIGSVSVTSTSIDGAISIRFYSYKADDAAGFNFSLSCNGGCACGGSPQHLLTSQSDDGPILTWDAATDTMVHHYIIEYGPIGFTPGQGEGITVVVDSSHYLLNDLIIYSNYDIYVYYDCNDDGSAQGEIGNHIYYAAPDGIGCVNFLSLANYPDVPLDPNITCTYGRTDTSPYQYIGVVNNGPDEITSRHTVITHQGTDPRTGNRLRLIPEHELYSIRLGNWQTGYGAESISYDFFVDTAEASILLMKYAAVLQNPGHSASDQPRFKFELLQTDNSPFPGASSCNQKDFIASANLGWETGSSSSILWKDWTTVGVNLSPYHGQTVRVRLTTYDCDQGGHYGYAYFTLNCRKKFLSTEICGESLTNVFTAPSGFGYRWYYEDAPNTTIGTDQSMTVNIQSSHHTLCCWVSFLDEPECGFELKASLSTKYPLADFSSENIDCATTYTFNNTSSISPDGVTPSSEPCQSALWYFGDGTISTEYSPTHTFSRPGTYTVTLICGMAGFSCTDTISQEIIIPDYHYNIQGDPIICRGASATIIAEGNGTVAWYTLDNLNQIISTDSILVVTPDTSTTYRAIYTDDQNCPHPLDWRVRVTPLPIIVPSFVDTTICPNNTSFSITATIEEGIAPYVVTWEGATETTHTDNIFQADIPIEASYCNTPLTVHIHVIDSNHCESDTSVHITITDTIAPTHTYTLPTQDALAHNCIFTVPNVTELLRPYVYDNCTDSNNLIITQIPQANSTIDENTTVNIYIEDACGNIDSTTVDIIVPEHLILSIVDTSHILCYGDTTGQITVSAHGGSLPYTYTWLPNIGIGNDTTRAQLPVGNYTITANDSSGCQRAISFTIHYLTEEMVVGTLASNQSICIGQSPAALIETGSTGGYESYYQWQQSIDGLTFEPIVGAPNTNTYTPGALYEDTYYRVAYISDSCGTLYTNAVHISVNEAIDTTIYDEVCQNATYEAHGFTITNTQNIGILIDSLTIPASFHCDSTIYLYLEVLPNTDTILYQTIIENELPYTWNDVVFNNEGEQTTTITNHHGCDSTIIMILEVLHNISTILDSTICESALPFTWDGIVFHAAGTQVTTYIASTGSDSAVARRLTTIPSQFTNLYDDICQNAEYNNHGFTVSSDSTQEVGMLTVSRVLTTSFGCDSTITLNLNIHPHYAPNIDIVACDSFKWNGQTYTENGVYSQHLYSRYGCDSIVTYHLRVIPTNLELRNLTDNFCDNFSAILEVTTDLENIRWSTGENTQQIEVTNPGVYMVFAHTEQCEAYERIVIPNCDFNIYIPNAITPSNVDGINDIFCIPEFNAQQLEDFDIDIFDRWGRIIFHSNDPFFKWNGRVNGKLLTPYTYTYRMAFRVKESTTYVHTGIIMVL